MDHKIMSGDSQPPQMVLSYLGPEQLSPECIKVLNAGIVVRKKNYRFYCVCCKINLTGAAPLKQHVHSEKHKKKTAIHESASAADLSDMSRLRDMSGESKAPQMDYLVPEQLSKESIEALNAGIVVREKNHRFYCICCKINLTGAVPLKQHVHSVKHKKRAIHGLVSSADLSNMSRLMFDTPQHFPWTVKTSITPELPSTMVYRNLSQPRGLVVIFNYHLTSQEPYQREGAQRDSFTLNTLFTRMGYTVRIHEDCTKQKTKYTLEHLQVDPILQQIDSFIMIVSSHGKENLIFNTNDHQSMSLDDIRDMFVDQACPNLRDKPKIFLVNFCRGNMLHNTDLFTVECDYVAWDGDLMPSSKTSNSKDMITWYASLDRFMVLRNIDEGTVFAQALCEVLAEHSHNTELGELYLRLGEVMHQKKGSTPEQQNFLFKKFYFNPMQLYD